jgi:outer membrane receptor protein involved in Fe transport
LAAGTLSVVGLLAAMAGPPEKGGTKDAGRAPTDDVATFPSRSSIEPDPSPIDDGKPVFRVVDTNTKDRASLQTKPQSPGEPRTGVVLIEIIEPKPATSPSSNMASTGNSTPSVVLVGQPEAPGKNAADTPAAMQSTRSPTGGVLLVGQDVQPKDIPAPPPQTEIPTGSPSSKTLSGFGINQNKTLAGFNPPSREPAEGFSVEPSPGTPPGPTGVLESNAALGVDLQKRSPLVVDPRIEGFHFGQIATYADGGYWFPARVDLDTVISKLGADNILNVVVIKGPYSVRYGPGFSFLDIETIPTPRFKDGYFDAHGSTSFGYRTNGRGWQGQQSIWGGNADWGFRLSYDLQTAQDYREGNGTVLPTAYNNHFADFGFGVDLDRNASLELRYFHNQQSNVLFPGLLTDVVALSTDAFTARLSLKDGCWYDRLTLDTWVNTTLFNGGSGNQATRNQIPQLDAIFPASDPTNNAINNVFGPVRLDMITNGYALSYGAREITTWGDVKGFNFSLGADIRVFANFYNEFDAFNFSVANGSMGAMATPANLGIPYARQIDPGLLFDSSIPLGDTFVVKVGARADFFTNQFVQFGPNVDRNVYAQQVGNPHDRSYFLLAGFATGEYKLTDEWTLQSGYGYAQRPPTLTELYAGGAFLGLIQNGFNSIYGNPELQKEQIHQLDLGLKAKYTDFRGGASAFYAWVPDYITYHNLGPFTLNDTQALGFFVPGVGNPVTPINRLRFKNTNLGTMYGFNTYGEVDVQPWLAAFGVLNYVAARDREIHEPLPGIAPLDSRVGLRIHDPAKTPRWGVEYFARMVAVQDLFAASLGEQRTGGFVVHNLRAYWQVRENFLALAGVENIGNRQYREHLDLRTGNGVFQPGVNFYVGAKVNY